MPQVTVYCTAVCPYCVRALKLLASKGVQIEEIRIDQFPERRAEMESRANGRTSVPQIFVGDVHVGGFDDLSELDIDDELDPMLGLN